MPLDGRVRADVAVLEVDEAFGGRLAKDLAPHSVLLINVQVDQLNRFHEPARVAGMLESFAAVADRHLVINADDDNLVALAQRPRRTRNPVIVRGGARARSPPARSGWRAATNPALAVRRARQQAG